MSIRTTRRILFVALFFLAPAPMLVLTSGWMPPASYVLFAAITALVAIVEGSAGPIPLVFLMFITHALLYGGLAWVVAWSVARATGRWSPATRRAMTLGVVAAALVVALGWDVYRTPFGRTPRGNLVEALS